MHNKDQVERTPLEREFAGGVDPNRKQRVPGLAPGKQVETIRVEIGGNDAMTLSGKPE